MKKTYRMMGMLLAVCLIASLIPTAAFAASDITQEDSCTCSTEDQVHTEGCALYEALVEPICICETLCEDGVVNNSCAICSAEGADLSTCKGQAPAQSDSICTCETDDPALHATDCPVYTAPENPECICEEQCISDRPNVWCDICGIQGIEVCKGTDDASPYNTGGTLQLSDILQSIEQGNNSYENDLGLTIWSFENNTLTITSDGDVYDEGNTTVCSYDLVNNGAISGGKFTGTVTNNKYIYNGMFQGDVINNYEILSGTFNGTVTNASGYVITGGNFYGTVENSGIINGGNFYGTVSGEGTVNGGYIPLDTSGLVNLKSSADMIVVGQETSIDLSPMDQEMYRAPSSITLTIDGSPANSEYYTYSTGILTIKQGCITSLSQKVAISGEAVEIAWITTEELPDGEVGEPYNFQFQARGVAPFTWGISGYLPDGLTLDTQTGTISGTPTAAGTFTIDFTVCDATVDEHMKTLSLTIEEKENAWYKLNIPADLQGKLIIESADPENQTVRVDADGQYWIMEGDSALKFLPATGYVFLEQPQITFGEGCGSAQTSDGVHYQFTGVAGDGTITAKMVQWQEYQIISGGDQTYTGSGDLLPINVNGDMSKLVGVFLLSGDSGYPTELTKDIDYSAGEGAERTTNIVLKESFLKTLDDGLYVLSIEYTDGATSTTFVVEKSSAVDPTPDDPTPGDPTPDDPTPDDLDDVPKTGDNSHTGLWLGLMLIAIAGLIACAVVWRRKRIN